MWRMLLPSGKLIGLLFFLLSFFFLKPNVYIQQLSRNELACPVMGTVILVIKGYDFHNLAL